MVLLVCVQARINEVNQAMIRGGLQFGATAESPQELAQYPFRHEKADYSVYWDVRKGLIPIVGGARESGMHCLWYFLQGVEALSSQNACCCALFGSSSRLSAVACRIMNHRAGFAASSPGCIRQSLNCTQTFQSHGQVS